ncbi:MAG: hypothetical protein A2Y59_01445 [Chloroflexi bacterium RBG_13_52_14]|nr:MAG: hypothetical protein A2Y59_01445 [Chloroflexi bacterium RBG_13_52_14]
MDAPDIVHVAIAPPIKSEANLIEQVATVINKDIYETRLLLTGKLPRIVAHYQNMESAESIARKLKDLGLPAFVCRDSELRKPTQIFRAHTMEFKGNEVIFKDNGGHERKIAATEVFLIIKGRINIQAETEITETKIRWGATLMLMASGIPYIRTVKEKISGRSGQTEYFARLYVKESSEQSVEILQLHMNYSFLGAKMAPSSVINFDTVLMKLREVFPQATFDDRLAKLSNMDVPPEKSRSYLEVNCKLLCLSYLVTK